MNKKLYKRQYETYEPNKFMALLKDKINQKWPNTDIPSQFEGIFGIYNFECPLRHKLNLNAYIIITTSLNCKYCDKLEKNTESVLDLVDSIAKLYGGEVISKKYNGAYEKLEFKCINNHVFKISYVNLVDHYSWCKACQFRGKARQLIKNQIIELKHNRSKLYAPKLKYTEHEQSYIDGVSNEYNENTIDGLQKKLHEKMPGARLRDNVFLGYCALYPLLCPNNHNIQIKDITIYTGTFKCKACCQVDSGHLHQLQQIATDRNGKLLSTTYFGDKKHILWECGAGHQWQATPNNVKKGSWCPTCLSYTNEERCRTVLNKLLGIKLEKCRPEFLRYPETDTCLELDGYNKELKIAFEYNGIQHYEEMFYDKKATDVANDTDNADNTGDSRLRHQQAKDTFKTEKCQELGITLLTIPYSEVKNKSDSDVIEYLIKLCNYHGFVANGDRLREVRAMSIQSEMPHTSKSDKFEKLTLDILNKRKATLIKINPTDRISTNRTKFKIKCRFGHITVKTYENINDKRGRWCPKCTSTLLKPLIESTNTKLDTMIIKDMDRFGICTICCKKCKSKINGVDFDDVAIKTCSVCCVDTKTNNSRERILSQLIHIMNLMDVYIDKMEVLWERLETFIELRENGLIQLCDKKHWAHVDYFEEGDTICNECKERARINFSKYKRCKHGKRIGKDRKCNECVN